MQKVLGGFVMLVLALIGFGVASNIFEAVFLPKHHAARLAEEKASEAAAAASSDRAIAESSASAAASFSVHNEAVMAGVDLYGAMIKDPADLSGWPQLYREQEAAKIRFIKAERDEYGPNWRVVLATEGSDLVESMLRKSGMPEADIEEARRTSVQNAKYDYIPGDVSPFKEAMPVYYDKKDDQGFDAIALTAKLKAAAALVDGAPARDDFNEYLRCEMSYAVHGGYVSTRPIAKPCEARLDAILAANREQTQGTGSATVAAE